MSQPAAVKDVQTTNSTGGRAQNLPQDSTLERITTHVDARGSLFEVYNLSWAVYSGAPAMHAYVTTVRPGWVKGWAVHESHADRYSLLYGEVQVVLFDGREHAATAGQLFVVTLTDKDRSILSIPIGVWHAIENIGQVEAAILNCPTTPYEYTDPDKYRLPIDTAKIPYTFHSQRGW